MGRNTNTGEPSDFKKMAATMYEDLKNGQLSVEITELKHVLKINRLI